MNKGVSIIICCYNSENVIAKTLSAIGAQAHENFAMEVVLVENNCTDNTVATATATWDEIKNPFPFRVVKEKQAGLNFARKKGVAEASLEYLIFCDDDNWLANNYAAEVYAEFERDESAGVLGGWSEGVYETTEPPWFSKVSTAYAVGGSMKELYDFPEYVWGAGMALRTKLAVNIFTNQFQTKDRAGDLLTAGGDKEICDYAKAYGYTVKKTMRLKFQHYITKERLSWKYCLKLFQGFGYSSAQRQKKNAGINLILKLRMCKALMSFIALNPGVFIDSIGRKEGQMNTLQFYSLLGAFKSAMARN
ncbi:MAG: glycosyltransferase family 2 protein [Bacteroidetes bacterium]|nr:glycosyltransferase family 2 protein [Bacteroidota bacterium]